MSSLINIESLKKHYFINAKDYIAAVDDVSFEIAKGETLGLVGESGSGKTTVGRCLIQLETITGGKIFLGGQDIEKMNIKDIHKRIQIVFQDPSSSLNPRFTVGRTLEEPLIMLTSLSSRDRKNRIRKVIDGLHLTESHLELYSRQLTSSEQQRVAIARAMVTEPEFIILDEITSHLDSTVVAEILDLLIQSQEQNGTSYLFISHDLTAVQRISHRIAIMYLGHLVEIAPSSILREKQFHPYSRALLSAVLYADPKQKPKPFVLEGEIPNAINPEDQCLLYNRCPNAGDLCLKAFPPLETISIDHQLACYYSEKKNSLKYINKN